MDSQNGVWIGSCLVAGTLAIALTVACSSDSENPGSADAALGGSTAAGGNSGNGGSANSSGGTGGAANGGSAASSSSGGASSGGTGGTASSTGGHAAGGSATGGAGAAMGSGGEHGTRDGGEHGSRDGGEPDASTDQDGGNPEAGTAQGGHDAGTDGSSRGAVCSPSADFPAGRYHLQMNSESDFHNDPEESLPGPYENVCSLSRAVGTLTITPIATQPTEYDLDFETAAEPATFAPDSFSFVDVASSTADSITLRANCIDRACPPDSGAISVVIDKHTGIVTSFGFSYEHLPPDFSIEFTDISGVGWLECPGEDAGAPPGVPALGSGGIVNSGYCGVGVPRLGCTDYEFIASSPPTCGPDGGVPEGLNCGSGFTGSCTNEPGSGYVLSCCPN